MGTLWRSSPRRSIVIIIVAFCIVVLAVGIIIGKDRIEAAIDCREDNSSKGRVIYHQLVGFLVKEDESPLDESPLTEALVASFNMNLPGYGIGLQRRVLNTCTQYAIPGSRPTAPKPRVGTRSSGKQNSTTRRTLAAQR